MKINKRNRILFTTILVFLFVFIALNSVNAVTKDGTLFEFVPDDLREDSTLPKDTPQDRIILIAQVTLYFLGGLTVILLVYGGFLYAFAGANPNSLDKAKKVIVWTIIGMAIVLGSYGLTAFLQSNITTTSGDSSNNCECVCSNTDGTEEKKYFNATEPDDCDVKCQSAWESGKCDLIVPIFHPEK